MTKAQKSLYSLLSRTNKLSKIAGEPYVAKYTDVFAEIAEATDNETAKRIIEKSRDKTLIPQERGGNDEAGQIETLLWIIYMESGGAIVGGAESWTRLRNILKDLIFQSKDFVQVSQNKATNTFPLLPNTAFKLVDKDSRTALATARGVDFKLENYNTKRGIRTQTSMLLCAILAEYAKARNQRVEIPLVEYAKLRGRACKSKNQLNEFRAEVKSDLDILRGLSWKYKERVDGKFVDSGFINLCGGTALIIRGVITFNFNTDLLPSLNRYAPADYPKEIWTADPRTSVFQFGRYIAQNYRQNEGKERQDLITVRALLATTDKIPSYDEVMKSNRNLRRITEPFFRDLDEIESLFYEVIDENGKKIVRDEYRDLDYQTFINCSLVIDYSDYPSHDERIAGRKKRQKKNTAKA